MRIVFLFLVMLLQFFSILKAQVAPLGGTKVIEPSNIDWVDSLNSHRDFQVPVEMIRLRLSTQQLQEAELLFEGLKESIELLGVNDLGIIDKEYRLIDIIADLGWGQLMEGNFHQAKVHFLLMTDWLEKLGLKESEAYVWASEKLGNVLLDIGDFSGSEQGLLEALRISDSLNSYYPIQKTVLLQSLARLYLNLGLNEKAEHFLIRAIEIQNAEKLDGDLIFGYSLKLLGDIRAGQSDWEEAIRLYALAKDIYMRPDYLDEPEQGLSLLLGLMTAHQFIGDYTKADSVSDMILDICSCVDDIVLSCAFHYRQMATLYWSQGYLKQAETYLLLSLNRFRQITGEQSASVMETKGLMFRFYHETQQEETARKLFNEYYDYVLADLYGSTCYLSENELLNRNSSLYQNLNYLSNSIRAYYENSPDYSEFQYDLALSTKTLALNSSIRMRDQLETRGDSDVLADYNYWLELMQAISKSNSEVFSGKTYWDSLKRKAEDLEKQLSRASEEFAQSRKQVTWDMIRDQLSEDEAAIEFSSFQYVDSLGNCTDSTLYTALILRAEDTSPRMVTLFDQHQLDELTEVENDDRQRIALLYRGAVPVSSEVTNYGNDLYELVWAPLDEHLQGVSKVHYSPSGSLHQISFSAIPISGDSLLMDRYELNRVGSTAVITFEKEEQSPTDIVLFGGMDYSIDTTQLQTLAHSISTKDIYSRGIPTELSRGGEEWPNLPGTRQEVEGITRIAWEKGVQTTSYLREEAIEERYKELGGKDSPTVLHIATHGFFFPDPETKQDDRRVYGIIHDRPNVYRESDDPMNRSGILFSGANASWIGKEPTTTENGILTAKEATYVPLTNTELVVLSACETGLGEIKGSEGVFGLQRGFKAAGAEYVMMSLWKVPDQETSEFMESFYGHYLSDHTIPDSYHHAQRVMRNKYPNDPYKWAGFVLMR